MHDRWKKIRKAMRTISRYSLQPSMNVESSSSGIRQASACALAPVAELDRRLLFINFGKLVLQLGPQSSPVLAKT